MISLISFSARTPNLYTQSKTQMSLQELGNLAEDTSMTLLLVGMDLYTMNGRNKLVYGKKGRPLPDP
jgi:hypothetical protein